METLNISQIKKLQESGAEVEARSYSMVLSVDDQNNRKTKTVFRAIVNGIMYEVATATFKKLLNLKK